jgi:guanylate kinase
MDGLLVIISGPSGSGKGTVVKGLDAAKGYARSISVTTRPPRAGEIHGRDYFYTTPDEFARMRQDNELLEHALFVGHFYGTPRKYVEEQINQGRVVVLEIEVQGALQVRNKFADAVLIFLMPPTLGELRRRLVTRATEDAVTIDARLTRALEEVPLIGEYDYLVINDEVSLAVDTIDAIVAAERVKPHRCQAEIYNFTR